jgi:hypothetical protein
VVVFGWTGVRAATLGVLPGAETFQVAPSEAKVPAIASTEFPPIEPIQPASSGAAAALLQAAAYTSVPDVRYVEGSLGVPVTMRPGVVTVYQLPPPTSAVSMDLPPPPTHFSGTPAAFSLADYSIFPPLGGQLSRILAGPTSKPAAGVAKESIPAALKRNGIDRWQLTSWALLRAQSAGVAGSRSLASGGSLGASQAGARLMYNFNRQVAASLRSTSDVGRRGGEVAAGVRIQPIAGLPLWIDAERRQRIGRYGGGRNAFALFFEGGVYDRPMPMHLRLDTYLQAGIVGLRRRDKFIDGALTLTRPVYKQFSAGFGVWGGAQPGLYRVDAGPRVTMRVRPNLRVHFDWRQRLAGNAQPGSGPAVTLAGDF